MTPARLLVVDDEAAALKNLSHLLRKEGYEVTACQSGAAGLQALQQHEFDLLLTDLCMKGVDGLALLRRTKIRQPDCEVIVITGHATLDSAVEAMKEGAFHYVAKPYRLDEVRQVVKSALDVVLLKRENHALKRRIEGYEGGPNIVTQDAAMLRLLDTARQVGPTDCNVLVSGESGTGKELLARYVHSHSGRANSRFVAVNCGALQAELLANELFGHEKGAFTGATSRKRGQFERAHGGTLVLDEIGDAPLAVQVRLLRALQDHRIRRVGGDEEIGVDVRVIAATHRPLEEMVANGRFREDLYYRINAFPIQLPPLRARGDDFAPLVRHLVARIAGRLNRRPPAVGTAAIERLRAYPWPGNVRELENFLERALIIGPADELVVEQPLGSALAAGGEAETVVTFDQGVRALLECALTQTHGKIYGPDGAAARLGLKPTTLQGKLRRFAARTPGDRRPLPRA